jgi:hypothetical protein
MRANLRALVIPTPANLKMLVSLRVLVIPNPANLHMPASLRAPREPFCFIFKKVDLLLLGESST